MEQITDNDVVLIKGLKKVKFMNAVKIFTKLFFLLRSIKDSFHNFFHVLLIAATSISML